MNHPGFDITLGQLLDCMDRRLNAALDVGLEDQHQFLDVAGVDLLHDAVQREHRFEVAGAGAMLAAARHLASGAFAGDHRQDVTGFRHRVQPHVTTPGEAGAMASMLCPCSLAMARTRPQAVPATM